MKEQVQLKKDRAATPSLTDRSAVEKYVAKFFRFMDLVDEAVFVVDVDKRYILSANLAATRISGYSREELVRMRLDKLHPPEELPLLLLEIQRLDFEKQTSIEDFSFIQKNGWRFPIDVRICRLRLDQEQFDDRYCVAFYSLESSEGLVADTAKRNQELLALMDVGQTIASALNLDEIIDLTMLKLAEVCDAKFVSIFFADDEGGLHLQRAHRNPPEKSPAGDGPWKIGLAEGPYSMVNEQNRILQIENAFTDVNFRQWRPIAERIGFGALVSLALIPRDQSIGVINLYYEKPKKFTQDEINFLRTATTYLSISIENARLYKEHQVKADQIAAINEITKSINSSLDLEQVIKTVTFEIKKIVDFDYVSISLFDEGSENMNVFNLASESLGSRLSEGRWVRLGDSSLGWVHGIGGSEGHGMTARRQEPSKRAADANYEARILIDNLIKSKMNVLLLSKDKYLGTFVLGKIEPHAYSNTHQLLFRQIAAQVATALENAKLYQETKRRLTELSVLADVSKTITSSLNIREVLDLIVKAAATAMDAKICTIWFVGDSILPSRYSNDSTDVSSELEVSLRHKAELIVEQKKPLIINDLGDRLRNDRSFPGPIYLHDLQSYLGVPVISRNKTIAVLSIYKEEISHFDDREIKLLSTIANQAAVAIENARLFERERRRVAQLGMVNEVGKKITSTLDLSNLLDSITAGIREIFGYRHVSVYLVDSETQSVVLQSKSGPSSFSFDEGVVRYSETNPIARAIRSAKAIFVTDLSREHGIDRASGLSGSMLCIPLQVAERVNGCLVLHSETKEEFDKRDQSAFEALASQVASAIENARLFEETKTNSEKLGRANEELENFVSTVSHDLKSPLVSVLGFSTILLNEFGKKLGPDGLHYLQRIQTNIRQMERLVIDLLELSRVGKVVNPFELVDINEIIQTVIANLQYQIKNKDIKIEFAGDFPRVTCDKDRIYQVFMNLIGNAVKYIGKVREPTISIGHRKNDDDFIFFIRDNGIGIEKKDFDRIFELFKTLKVKTDTDGTGVGLTIVKRIVENHKGRVWVESEKMEGSTFYFTLPRDLNDPN